jgi:phenylacetic acid degradation protein PaaD
MPVQAQCVAKNEAFQSGEHVMYDLYFNWKFIWKKVGLASLTTNATTYRFQPAYRFNLLSVGSKKTDFFFKMRDTLTCYVSDKLEPLYFRKAAEEGKRYTVDEAWFSYDDGIATVKQRRTWHNPVREPQEMEYSDSRCIFDMLSILAQARLVITETHLNAGNRTQGGALFTLADLALAAAANSHGTLAFSLSSNITFLRSSGPGDILYAEARERYIGRTTGHYQIDITNQNGELVATFESSIFRKGDALPFTL